MKSGRVGVSPLQHHRRPLEGFDLMLTELRVRNFAIIESLTLPLAPGFNVLSGETGAGKSIIVGALGLLLGDRASVDLIRTGSDRAVVEGVFDVGRRPEIVARLDERG